MEKRADSIQWWRSLRTIVKWSSKLLEQAMYWELFGSDPSSRLFRIIRANESNNYFSLDNWPTNSLGFTLDNTPLSQAQSIKIVQGSSTRLPPIWTGAVFLLGKPCFLKTSKSMWWCWWWLLARVKTRWYTYLFTYVISDPGESRSESLEHFNPMCCQIESGSIPSCLEDRQKMQLKSRRPPPR